MESNEIKKNDPRLTFTRDSEAIYVDEDGILRIAKKNEIRPYFGLGLDNQGPAPRTE